MNDKPKILYNGKEYDRPEQIPDGELQAFTEELTRQLRPLIEQRYQGMAGDLFMGIEPPIHVREALWEYCFKMFAASYVTPEDKLKSVQDEIHARFAKVIADWYETLR